jgi:hypothetical protein
MIWNNRRRSYRRGHAALIFGLAVAALLGVMTTPSQAGLKIIRIPEGGTGGTQISQFNRPFLSPYMELIIRGLDLPPGNKQALLTKLQKSREHLDAGNGHAARTMLSTFINQIKPTPVAGSIRSRSTGRTGGAIRSGWTAASGRECR